MAQTAFTNCDGPPNETIRREHARMAANGELDRPSRTGEPGRARNELDHRQTEAASGR